jgi:hypothetical protein
MADIHILPLAGLDGDHLQRLADDLAAAFEAGEELGSRVPHIRASARVFLCMASELQSAVDHLADELGRSGLTQPTAIAALEQLAEECRALSRAAAGFPHPLDPPPIDAPMTAAEASSVAAK